MKSISRGACLTLAAFAAGIAARVPGISGIEANSRWYVPAANEAWKDKHPGLFIIRDGKLHTAGLTGEGLAT